MKFLLGLVLSLIQFAIIAFVAFRLSGCAGDDSHGDDHSPAGGGSTPAAEGGAPAGGAAAPAVDLSKPGTATLKGKITFAGAPPARGKIPMSADKLCLEVNQGVDVFEESIVVSEGGGLENVFVYLKIDGGDYKAPAENVVLDQRGCIYRPHVMGMMAGQQLEIRNSDKSNHNINVKGKKVRFNVNQAPKSEPLIRKDFRKPEDAPVKVSCQVHPWMNMRIWVLSHPFFAVAGEGGVFELPEKLPAGTYTVVAWHEELGEQTQQVTVADGETKEIAFEFKQ